MPRQVGNPCSGCGRLASTALIKTSVFGPILPAQRAGPVRQRLCPGRLGIGEVRGAEHADENLRLPDLSRRRIGDPDPLARIVNERLLPGDVVRAAAALWGYQRNDVCVGDTPTRCVLVESVGS
jgi:hypothetical protein